MELYRRRDGGLKEETSQKLQMTSQNTTMMKETYDVATPAKKETRLSGC